MADAKLKSEEKDKLVIEEDINVFQHTITQISPSKQEKRKQEEAISVDSPSKYVHHANGSRFATTERKETSLAVPFWKELNHPTPSFEFRANEIGCFSLIGRTDDKKRFEDKRYLRVYKYPLEALNVNLDLKVGESDFTFEGQSKSIDAMLWWTLRHKNDIFKNNQFTFDFLSARGGIRLIMFSIFETRDDWLLAVIKFRNAYFLCECVTDTQLKVEQNMTPEVRSFRYYGHKFEEYVTKNDATTEKLNPSKQFIAVFQSTIGSYRLLYSAEIDCVVERSPSMSEHIELKVCAGKSIDDLAFKQ
ncbi:unnamed protein product [Rotaria sp. Silwood2]|nr:unnamed protein product [Rotaria sp. Silwood2]